MLIKIAITLELFQNDDGIITQVYRLRDLAVSFMCSLHGDMGWGNNGWFGLGLILEISIIYKLK